MRIKIYKKLALCAGIGIAVFIGKLLHSNLSILQILEVMMWGLIAMWCQEMLKDL